MIPEFGIKRENEERRDGGCAVVYNPESKKYAVARQHADGFLRMYSGGVDANENIQEGVLRELREESGLYDFGQVEKIGEALSHYYNSLRNVNRVAHATCFLVILNSIKTQPVHLEEHEKFSLEWVTEDDLLEDWRSNNQNHDYDHWIYFFGKAREKMRELGYS